MNAQEAKALTAESLPRIQAQLAKEKEEERLNQLRLAAAAQEAADNAFRARMTACTDEIRYACTRGRNYVNIVTGSKDDTARVVAALIELGYSAYLGTDGRETQDCDGDGNFGKPYYQSWAAYIVSWK